MSDVLVLGGGVIGCAVALELADRGASVTLVEGRGIGRGASQASAGMLAPYKEGLHDPVLQALGIRSLALHAALARRLGATRVLFAQHGSMDVAFDQAGEAELEQFAEALSRDGVDHERLDAAGAMAVEPALAPDVTAALLVPPHAIVGVPELAQALWEAAATRGARRVPAEVQRISPGHGTVRVETSAGPIDAPYVVLATGCWSAQIDLAGAPPLPVRPVRGQLLALQWDGAPLARTLWGPRCYLVPRADGTLLVGATAEEVGFDERATAAGVHDLLEAACELIPRAWNAGFGSVRVGLRPGTPDDRPIVGRSARIDGLVYATGHYRNGALLAPLTASVVADLIQGRNIDPMLKPLDPLRFGSY